MIAIIYGVIAGIVTGLGMGGGTILILLLSLFMNLNQHAAQAINLIFFIPTSLAAIAVNIKQKNIDNRLATIIIIFGVIGATIGSLIAQCISSNNLKKYFSIFVILIGLHEIYGLYKEYRNKRKEAY